MYIVNYIIEYSVKKNYVNFISICNNLPQLDKFFIYIPVENKENLGGDVRTPQLYDRANFHRRDESLHTQNISYHLTSLV